MLKQNWRHIKMLTVLSHNYQCWPVTLSDHVGPTVFDLSIQIESGVCCSSSPTDLEQKWGSAWRESMQKQSKLASFQINCQHLLSWIKGSFFLFHCEFEKFSLHVLHVFSEASIARESRCEVRMKSRARRRAVTDCIPTRLQCLMLVTFCSVCACKHQLPIWEEEIRSYLEKHTFVSKPLGAVNLAQRRVFKRTRQRSALSRRRRRSAHAVAATSLLER